MTMLNLIIVNTKNCCIYNNFSNFEAKNAKKTRISKDLSKILTDTTIILKM